MTIFDIEPEVQDGGRAFGKTQELFTGAPPPGSVARILDAGWYGTEIDANRGAFCFVSASAGLSDWVGEFLRVKSFARPLPEAVVYCMGESTQIEEPIALTRRAFAQIELLALAPIPVYVQVIV